MSLRALSLAACTIGLLALLPAAATGDACLPGLSAYADNGSVTLTWPDVADATAYQVAVRPAGGDFAPLSPQVPASGHSFTYTPAVPADSYEFGVVALHGGSNPIGSFCTVTVTRIPFFPTWTASVVGLVGALGTASFILGRRR